MADSRFATIDVGTNAVLLLVVERESGGSFRVLAERTELTRLGRGVDANRRLAPESIRLTAEVVGRYAAEARSLGAQQIACVATSAARDAQNGQDFFAAVNAQAGLQPEVISGDEEAQLSYAAAEHDFGPSPKVVIDIGGGSTEFVYGAQGQVSFHHSFDLGSVRLTERFVHSDPPTPEERAQVRSALDRAFESLPPLPQDAQVIGVAGTATTVYAVHHNLVDPSAQVHGQVLSLAEVDVTCEQLWSLSLEERLRCAGLHPKRADVIPAGALVLSRAMHRLGAKEVRVSDRGVRWGLLYARFGQVGAA